MTGAAIPEGADAVLRREDVVEHGAGLAADGECITSISLAPNVATRGGVRVGDNIRRRGENARAEETVLTAGTVLTAAALGTLAAVGCVWPRVHPRVRVAVITTGDELVSPQATPGPYQIRNSNAAVIRAVLGSHAWIELVTRPDGTSVTEPVSRQWYEGLRKILDIADQSSAKKARAALLRGRLVTPLAFATKRVLHGVALVEDDHSVEVRAQPFDDLPDARNLLAPVVGA